MNVFIPDGFTDPIWLFLGVLLWGAFWYFSTQHRLKENFSNLPLLQEVYGKQSFWYTLFQAGILGISIVFFFILAGPYQEVQKQKDIRNGVDIEIVFDLSYSMIATDILPNRLEVAKQVLVSFIGELSQDRVGLILFAGKPFQSVPLTYDYDFLQAFIQNISIETINQNYERLQGTAIGDALVLAAGALTQETTAREKVLVFITDGEANKGVDPELALKLLKEKGIKTYTIWVGKNEETTITLPGLWGFPQKVLVSGVDEELLKKIASETGGLYFKADSETTFQEILKTIAQLEKKELEVEVYSLQKSLTPVYGVCLLILLFGLWSILYFKNLRFAWI